MDLGTLKTDQALENEGAWVDLDSTTQIKVASNTSSKYRKAAKKRLQPFKHVPTESIPDEEQDALTVETMADALLLDWRSQPLGEEPVADKEKWPHVIYVDGEEIEYTHEEARRLLKEIPRFRYMVASLATSIDTFKRAEREETAKK